MKLNSLILLGTSSLLVSTIALSVDALNNPKTEQSSNPPVTLIAQNQTVALMSGNFMKAEAPTTGKATIITEGGHKYLVLDSAFSTSNQGPDLHVLLDPDAKPPQTYQNMGRPLNLGKLHSVTGTQRYPIPDSINAAQYKSVVIWCRMANATFGYAPLQTVRK
ncbi:permease [Aphanothece hegewaldii CCALA 016]|uniref:Permease n=1 Tax=Aphanothece hegewaldii CCALA 016 TaxID=2107694 RepID=A0A2T1LXA1_9CHRO|nr:DM13 domain-containing protein [Aphanothece hegewaldii]PSF36733.1 permease [Aphanothece hegewaldii CCALA 016]